jgi:DNA-binding transcriptional LysR family regulator
MSDLRRLRCFVVLADELHYRRASERLRIAQPALTRHIQQLEHMVGHALFQRSKRRVMLTEAGSELLAGLRPALAALDKVIDDVRARGRRLLRIGYIRPALYGLLPPALARWQALHPDIRLDLQELYSPELAAQLEHGGVDVAYIGAKSVPPDATYQSLLRSPYRVCVSRRNPLAARHTIGLADLDGVTLITPASREPLHGYFEGRLRDAGIAVSVVHATSVESILALVRGGVGVAIVPDLLRLEAGDDVAFLAVHEGLPSLDLGIAAPRRSADALVDDLIRICREVAQTMQHSLDQRPSQRESSAP